MTGEAILTIGQHVFIDESDHQFTRSSPLTLPTAMVGGTSSSRSSGPVTDLRSHMPKFDRLILAKKIRSPSILDRSGDEVPERRTRDKELRDLRQTLCGNTTKIRFQNR